MYSSIKTTAYSLLLICCFVIAGQKLSAQNNSKKENVEVVFNHKLKLEDVMKIKTDLVQKGMTLNYRKLVFDEQQLLTDISYEINCGDKYGGGDEVEHLTDASRNGFYRDYEHKTNKDFICGDLAKFNLGNTATKEDQ